MKRSFTFVSAVLIVILICVCLLFVYPIGNNKSNIEKDARNSQQIEDNWQVAKDTTDTMSAMIFYPEDQSDHTYSIYVNPPGLSFGYFFRGGGSVMDTEQMVAEFSIEGYDERAFVSMNQQKICRVEIDDGRGIQRIDLDSTKPFAFILPKSAGSVTLYDVNDTIVHSIPHGL